LNGVYTLSDLVDGKVEGMEGLKLWSVEKLRSGKVKPIIVETLRKHHRPNEARSSFMK
jgi:hypothetical protein